MNNNKAKLSAEALLSVLDQQDCGVITVNEAGLITQINTTAERLTGWSESEALHQNIGHVYGANFGDTGRTQALTQHILEGSGTGSSSTLVELTSLSGKKHMVKHAAMPLFDETSSPTGAILSFRDVTTSLELEEKLTHSKNTLQSIIDNFPLPMGAENRDGQLVIINQAFTDILGRTKESCLGQD